MRALVVGGTGSVGSNVAAGLVAKGADVRVLTREPEKAASLPKGQVGVVGDLDSISVLRAEMTAADGVFLMFPPQDNLSFKGLNAVALATECRPANVVMMTAIQVDDALVGVGHCGGMWPAEIALARSGLRHTILRPNYFFQNDVRQRENLLSKGVYASPIGDVGLSRCDIRDIADAAVASFQNGASGGTYVVHGPDVMTGSTTAAVWADALDRPVRYGGHGDPAEMEQALKALYPEHWAFDLRKMYEVFQRSGAVATSEEVDRLAALVGHDLRTFRAYAKEAANQWTGAA